MWFVKVIGTCIALFSVGLLAVAVKRWRGRRTIRNWFGQDVHTELAPVPVALLLGMHPSAIFMLKAVELEIEGRLRILAEEPLRLEWTGRGPEGRVENAFLDAVGEDGAVAPEGVLRFLEVLFEEVDRDMAAYSGRRTQIYFRDGAETLYEQFLAEGEDDPRMIPWFLLHRDVRDMTGIPADGVGGRLRQAMRRLNLAVQHLVHAEDYFHAVREAKQGFFRYRKDLAAESRLVGKDVDQYWPTWYG